MRLLNQHTEIKPSSRRRQWLKTLTTGLLLPSWLHTRVLAQDKQGSLSDFFTKREAPLSNINNPPSSTQPLLQPASVIPLAPTGGSVSPPSHLYPSAPAIQPQIRSASTTLSNGVEITPLPPSTLESTITPGTPPTLIATPPPPVPLSPYPPFQIISFQGEVRIDGRFIRTGDPIEVGQTLTTGSNGSVVYRWLDEIIKVYPYTQISHGSKPSEWMQLKGRITVSSKAAPEPRIVFTDQVMVQLDACSLHIDTSLQVFSITGDPINTAYVCVCFGKANLARSQNVRDILQINAHHHNFPHYVGHQRFQPTAEVLGHTDAELVLLQSILQQIG